MWKFVTCYVCHKFSVLSGTIVHPFSRHSFICPWGIRHFTWHPEEMSLPGMDWFIIWETAILRKRSHHKESINSFCYHIWSTLYIQPRAHSPVCCCVKLCLMRVDVSLSWESIVKRIMTAPDEPLFFFWMYVFNTKHIGVYTAGMEWKCQCRHV